MPSHSFFPAVQFNPSVDRTSVGSGPENPPNLSPRPILEDGTLKKVWLTSVKLKTKVPMKNVKFCWRMKLKLHKNSTILLIQTLHWVDVEIKFKWQALSYGHTGVLVGWRPDLSLGLMTLLKPVDPLNSRSSPVSLREGLNAGLASHSFLGSSGSEEISEKSTSIHLSTKG